ncbi:MAG TPA: extracellular solute-binding protein [Herpetosiphonaceae bacterium]|nr:extracellular solute-binding protein [Herpetosiphonaceae bacterium]
MQPFPWHRRLMALAIGSLLFVACGAAAPTATPAAPPKITIAAIADPAVAPMRTMITEGLAEADLGFEVEWVDHTFSGQYDTAVQRGKTADFDLYMMDDPWVPAFALDGVITDLDGLGYAPDAGFIPATLELGYWPPHAGARVPGIAADAPSRLYTLPIIGDTQLFFYRKDLIDEPPETWDDVRALAAQADPANRRYLLAMRGVAGNPIVTEWFPYLYSFGGEMFDDQWNVDFNSPAGVAALQLFLDLKAHQPPGVENFDAPEQGACYLSGQCMMNIEWTGYILLAEDPAGSQVVGKTGWTIPPRQERHASELGNFVMGIAAGSANKPAALKFLQWFTSDATQREFARRRGVPVRSAVFADPELQQQFPWLPTIQSALTNGVARPRTPEWSRVEEILGAQLHRAVVGEVGAQEALDTAAQEVTAFLSGKGYYK